MNATVLFLWTLVGGLIFGILESIYYHPLDSRCILRPDFIYDTFSVNFFGVIFLTILFNLLCPIISIFYWICKFIHFIFTVGRDK